MKRAGYFVAVIALALVLPAMGQIRGTPASVTSMGPGRGFNPGPPASVTSLGPLGYTFRGTGLSPLIPSAMGWTATQFTNSYFFHDGRNHGRVNLHTRRNHYNYGGYLYVPYAYPVPVAVEPEPDEAVESEPPAPTIFEHRATSARPPSSPSDARYGTHYLDNRDQTEPAPAQPAADEQPPAASRPQVPFVLVYRDGHEQEVQNYAIVGQTLYDLGTFVAHKIPLTELNLKATIKANDDRGVEFSVPSSVNLD